VNSLTSVSLEPPLLSFSPSRSSLTWSRMRRTGRFGVNLLASQHERFAIRATPAGADRFAGLDWEPGRGGVPPPHRRPRHARVRDRRRAPRRRPLDRRRPSRKPAHHLRRTPAHLLRRRIPRPTTASLRRPASPAEDCSSSMGGSASARRPATVAPDDLRARSPAGRGRPQSPRKAGTSRPAGRTPPDRPLQASRS
jgi:Flavin reductase like domain